MALPLVVIIGRPNVGKSTLFNGLIGMNRAVTHSTAGVTRDPIEEPFECGGRKCLLVDTGGFTLEKEELDRMIVERALRYLDLSACILLLVEVKGLTPEDEELIALVRPYQEKTVLVANKADNTALEQEVWNYYATGFREVIPVSAVHRKNLDRVLEAAAKHVEASSPGTGGDEERHDGMIRLAILGKPNTGKSTLSNTLLSEERSIVSDIPGTTRDVLIGIFEYKNKFFKIMDTAGICRKKKVTEDLEYYSVHRAFGSIEAADIVLLMIDSQEGLTEQDKKIAAQAVRKGRGIILVVNKWDLQPKVSNAETAFQDRIRFLFPILGFAPVVFISALKKEGTESLLQTVLSVYRELHRRIKTSSVNKHFADWILENPPPRHGRGAWKAKYIVQSGVNPQQFIMFVNKKIGFPSDYIQYIKNRIRKDFGISKVPVRLEVRE